MAPDNVGLDRSVQAVSQREIRSTPQAEPKSIAVEVTSVSEKPDFITRFRAHHRENPTELFERVKSLRAERKIHSGLSSWGSLIELHMKVDKTRKSKRTKRSGSEEVVPKKPPRYPVNRPQMPIPKKRTSIPSYSDSDENIYETITGTWLKYGHQYHHFITYLQ